ncbi:MAG: 4Fe-4S binding protein [Deltaproteobacteria bacterium]|nr:4Fe-4S binding protein [Deltaproteobacteria bacterium]
MTPKDPTLGLAEFQEDIVGAYLKGRGDELPADEALSRSIIPAATASIRDFSHIAPEIPMLIPDKCVGCMACVTECPDTAILAKVVTAHTLQDKLQTVEDPQKRSPLEKQYFKTTKYFTAYEKRKLEPGFFNITVDPTKCKGCGECVVACGENEALKMVQKNDVILKEAQRNYDFYQKLPPTSKTFIQEKILPDMMLCEESLLFKGGAGNCMGCGETTAIRMMLAATGFVYGKENIGLVAATGCNTVYGSTYPFNPYQVPWTNSLFENACADAMGIRARWNQMGWQDKKIWVIGGDGAMLDIGFQSLSRMLTSGMDIKVIVLDTQAYSNTGGQASTASFLAQNAKMSSIGKRLHGKTERRKELANIAMMHPDIFVAQTTATLSNHFYKCILGANEYKGPALVNVYTPCPPEHGISDDAGGKQAKLAVYTRAFPLFIYDPRAGQTMKERLSLRGNPAATQDWYTDPQTKEAIDFIAFARTEGRFLKQFDPQANPSETLKRSQEDRLTNWRLLQELAGL